MHRTRFARQAAPARYGILHMLGDVLALLIAMGGLYVVAVILYAVMEG
jgi:hypothetical protein